MFPLLSSFMIVVIGDRAFQVVLEEPRLVHPHSLGLGALGSGVSAVVSLSC